LHTGVRAKYAKRVVDSEPVERELRFAELAPLLEIATKLFFSVH
jgi:hypothetical protein